MNRPGDDERPFDDSIKDLQSNHRSSLFPNRSAKFIRAATIHFAAQNRIRNSIFHQPNNDIERTGDNHFLLTRHQSMTSAMPKQIAYRLCISHTNMLVYTYMLQMFMLPMVSRFVHPIPPSWRWRQPKTFSAAAHNFLFVHSILNCGLLALSIARMHRACTHTHTQAHAPHERVIHTG